MPFLFHPDSMGIFYKSMATLVASKGLAVASPYILKKIIDNMTTTGNVDFYSAGVGIGLFGACRVVSTLFQEYRMI